MGLVYAEIELVNAGDISLHEENYISASQIRRLNTKALVDTGAVMMAINETIKAQLGLKVRDTRAAQMADGSIANLDVVGPIEVKFRNRFSICNAMVLPGDQEVLLGAIPMEEMDVIIHPASQQLIVNPEHPLKPQMALK